ncbi:uncharacterized protein EKO05_0011342 [Ascochyta rabiei]|uniref:Uncharacterized protein n=1 Tax=Didymella rabiei TaxID=5454 RepID=A0A163C6E8_DIDRA|nr:uncharacterized protein EKO05_0011342 [Ascochyta rabiei]KZM22234.1 hypothetical protein ST47_g6605 [Ascochyta rabiei]UPX21142.1 hypothetical protein EKO05_0011342 [Ascochyta rabiei]
MTRTFLSVASAVLLLASVVNGVNVTRVDAKADAQIHLYPFNTFDCTEGPVGSPLELKQGECVNFHAAHSVKPMLRSDHQDWINEVNELRTNCKLETFRVPGCPDSGKMDQYLYGRSGDMPENFGRCLVGDHSSDDDSFSSAKFVCGKLENPELLCTSIIEHTSWSMDPTGSPSSSVITATYTGSLSATGRFARIIKPTHIGQGKPTLEPRFKTDQETKSVWMLHPWSKSMVCYLCYPEKKGDYSKIECRYGKDFPAQCGGNPVGGDGEVRTPMTTTTATTTATTTTHTTSTKLTVFSMSGRDDDDASMSDSESDFTDMDLDMSQKRSWHTPVKFGHPFVQGQHVCADAEWEKRGRPESYIKIQHCHICDHKDRGDSQWIGLPETAVDTVSKTTTTTNTIRHTLSRRHDQL